MLKHTLKKALRKGAFFASVCYILLSTTFANAKNCTSYTLSSPEKATVKWVYDGDSLQLTDKRKIRIIGIDTPETKHHKQKAQAYGAKAREALRALLKKHHYQITLRYSKERLDKYSRTLAHVYLPDGTNISNWLLERGFAKTLAFPPNVALANCYKQSEKLAQAQGLRLWRYKSNQIKVANSLPRRVSGYVRLIGKVSKIKHYKKSLVMELGTNSKSRIQVKLKKQYLRYFTKIDPDKLWNKTIIVTGILRNKKGKRTLHLTHSTQLELATEAIGQQKLSGNSKTNKKTAKIKWSSE